MNQIEEKNQVKLKKKLYQKPDSFSVNLVDQISPRVPHRKNISPLHLTTRRKKKLFAGFQTHLCKSKETKKFNITGSWTRKMKKFEQLQKYKNTLNTSRMNTYQDHIIPEHLNLNHDSMCKKVHLRRLSGNSIVLPLREVPKSDFSPRLLLRNRSPHLSNVPRKKKQDYHRSCAIHTTRPQGYTKRDKRLKSDDHSLSKIFTCYTKRTPDPVPMKKLDEVVNIMGNILVNHLNKFQSPKKNELKMNQRMSQI